MVPCAYLRVFEPLDALPVADRERWGRYVADGNGLSVRAALQTEARSARTRLISGRGPNDEQLALVRRVGDRIHLCPLQLAERQAVALLAFRELLPGPVIDAFVSPKEARTALRQVERLSRPPHIQESSWEVPLRWFAAFADRERHFVDPPEGGGPRLLYLTAAYLALERLDRALGIVEATIADGDELVDELADLVDWIANFHDDSLLELDYGGLATTMQPAELAVDETCADVWTVLEDLERGDAPAAAAGYERLRARWDGLREPYRTN